MKDYFKVDNFIEKEYLKIISDYCKIKFRNQKTFFGSRWDPTRPGQGAFTNHMVNFYADPLTEALLLKQHQKMEEVTGLKLFPTYSFWRMYVQGSTLERHSDRPSCEISATITIDKSDDTDWPIYMDGTPIYTNKGDAAIYKGCEVDHWREPLRTDWNLQVFLHYVDANGKNTQYALDERHRIGVPGQGRNPWLIENEI